MTYTTGDSLIPQLEIELRVKRGYKMDKKQIERLRRIEAELRALYCELKNEPCSTNLLLLWVNTASIITEQFIKE